MFDEQQVRTLHLSGISKTKAAQILGAHKYHLEKYLKVINLDWKPRVRGGSYVIDGVKDTLARHANRLGVTVAAIRWRLERNQPLDAPPVIDPVIEAEAKAFTELRQEGVPAMKAAKIVGRPYESLKNAAKRFCPDDYLKVVSTAPRGRWAYAGRVECDQDPNHGHDHEPKAA